MNRENFQHMYVSLSKAKTAVIDNLIATTDESERAALKPIADAIARLQFELHKLDPQNAMYATDALIANGKRV